MAADLYGARILKRGIEDDPSNFTRFFLLKRPGSRPTKSWSMSEWKTSLVFQTRNVPGALFRCLSAFALRDISCTKIESRPLRGKPWEYWFYLDFLGRADDAVSQKALGHLAETGRLSAGARDLSEGRLTGASNVDERTFASFSSKQWIFREVPRQLFQDRKRMLRPLLAKVDDGEQNPGERPEISARCGHTFQLPCGRRFLPSTPSKRTNQRTKNGMLPSRYSHAPPVSSASAKLGSDLSSCSDQFCA